MSHHSGYPMDQDSEEYKKLMADLGMKKIPIHPLGLGATGKFPEGKLNHNDEGGIMIGLTTKDGKVVMDFGKATHWIGFTKEEARKLGEALIRRSEED